MGDCFMNLSQTCSSNRFIVKFFEDLFGSHAKVFQKQLVYLHKKVEPQLIVATFLSFPQRFQRKFQSICYQNKIIGIKLLHRQAYFGFPWQNLFSILQRHSTHPPHHHLNFYFILVMYIFHIDHWCNCWRNEQNKINWLNKINMICSLQTLQILSFHRSCFSPIQSLR